MNWCGRALRKSAPHRTYRTEGETVTVTLRGILLVLAFVCFLLATVDAKVARINFTAMGLALWVFSLLIQ